MFTQLCSRGLTLATGIGLDEFVAGTGFFELRGQPGELGEGFVDYADLGGQAILVDIEGQVATNKA